MYPENWLSDPSFEKCLVARLHYYDTAERTLYLSSHKYQGIIDGIERACIPRLAGSPNFQINVTTSEKDLSTSVNYGSLSIINADGLFDEWMDFAFDGRDITIFIGPPDGDVDKDFITIFDGLIDKLTIDNSNSLSITFRDYSKKLDKPIQAVNFADPESITFTTDTTKTVTISSSLKDTPKPLVFGQVYNIEPVLINAASLVYMVSNEKIQAIDAVYDKGIILTPVTGYRVDLDKGILELVNNPSGTITCDVKGVMIQPSTIIPTPEYAIPDDSISFNSTTTMLDLVGNFSMVETTIGIPGGAAGDIAVVRTSTVYDLENNLGSPKFTLLDSTDANIYFGFVDKNVDADTLVSYFTTPSTEIPSLFYAVADSAGTGIQGYNTSSGTLNTDLNSAVGVGGTINFDIDNTGTDIMLFAYADGDLGTLLATAPNTALNYNNLTPFFLVVYLNTPHTFYGNFAGTVLSNLPTPTYSDKLIDIVKDISYRSGIDISKLQQSNNVANISTGIYIKDRENSLDIIDQLMASINGFTYFNTLGELKLSSIVVPNNYNGCKVGHTTSALSQGDIVYQDSIDDAYILLSDNISPPITVSYSLDTLSENHILVEFNKPYIANSGNIIGEIEVRSLNIPNFRTKVAYKKNYTVSSDLAAATLAATREFMSIEYRNVTKEDLSIQSKFKSSIEREAINSLIISNIQANSLASGLLAKYGRQIYTATFTMLLTDIVNASIGSILLLSDIRFGLLNGKLASIVALDINYLEGIATISADFYTYPYINQYTEYSLEHYAKAITGSYSVTDYTVSVSGSSSVSLNVAQHSLVRRFDYLPNLTTVGHSTEVVLCQTDNTGDPIISGLDTKVIFTLISHEELQIDIIADTSIVSTLSYTSNMYFQIIYDFDTNEIAVVSGISTLSGPIAGELPHLSIFLDNSNNTNSSEAYFLDTIYPITGRRWLEIAQQEVPSYLTMNQLELENGTYLLVEV